MTRLASTGFTIENGRVVVHTVEDDERAQRQAANLQRDWDAMHPPYTDAEIAEQERRRQRAEYIYTLQVAGWPNEAKRMRENPDYTFRPEVEPCPLCGRDIEPSESACRNCLVVSRIDGEDRW